MIVSSIHSTFKCVWSGKTNMDTAQAAENPEPLGASIAGITAVPDHPGNHFFPASGSDAFKNYSLGF